MEIVKTVISSRIAVVFCFIALDIFTGWIKAFSTGSYNSSVMRKGLWHKLSELLGVGFGYLCDCALPRVGVTLPVQLSAAIVAYIVVMECTSIIENLGAVSPAIGKFLSKYFEKVDGEK